MANVYKILEVKHQIREGSAKTPTNNFLVFYSPQHGVAQLTFIHSQLRHLQSTSPHVNDCSQGFSMVHKIKSFIDLRQCQLMRNVFIHFYLLNNRRMEK
jgi:hypothetical protein